MNNYKVYKLTSPSEKVYIGITCQTLKKRFMNGRGYKECPRIHGAIQKYGFESFKKEVVFSDLSKEEAEAKEIELISLYKSTNPEFGYNIDNGGNTTGSHSEETKKKISAANKGKKVSEESRERMRKAQKGNNLGDKNPFYGKHHSEKTKKEHSDFMRGNKYNLGNHHTEEFKKMKSKQMHEKYSNGKHPMCKKVVHLNDRGDVIERFASLTMAAGACGISPATMWEWIHKTKSEEWQYERID